MNGSGRLIRKFISPDGGVWLRPLEPPDAAEHFDGEDGQLVRWYSGGVAPSVEHVGGYPGHVAQAWVSGGAKLR